MLFKYFPGLFWLQHYTTSTFKNDLWSGLTIAFMLIPQGMGYAMVAGLPPETGLYACIFPPIIYALLGTSNKISIGPVALDSILILNGLSLLEPSDPQTYLELAITLTLMVGVIQYFFGLIRFGFIANFLSFPVITGYTSAAALVIIASQLENMVGVKLEEHSFIPIIGALASSFEQWHLVTIAIGLLGLLVVHFGKHLHKSFPFALLVLIGGMLLSGLLNGKNLGLHVIDHIPAGIPSLALPSLALNHMVDLLPLALTVALMGYAGSMSICKSQEQPSDKRHANPNQELLAMGAANIVGSFFKAFPVSASFSRSAAFRQAGALTQVSAVISAVFIVIILLFLTPTFAAFPLPKALLSAIIISSVIGLFKVAAMRQLWAENRYEFSIMLATFLGTLTLGIQAGLFIGISLSITMVIFNTARPHMTELGAIEEGKLFRNINRFNEAQIREDVLIFRFDAPLYFANKDYFVERLYQWMKRRQPSKLRYVIFNAESVNSIDTSSIHMLQKVIGNCESLGITFLITNAIGPVRDAIKTSSLQDYFSEKTVFSSVHDAILYIDKGINENAGPALQTNR